MAAGRRTAARGDRGALRCACTLVLLRDVDGFRLLFHGAELTGAELPPRVHQDLVEALQRLAE